MGTASEPAVAQRILELLSEVSCCDREGRHRPSIHEQLARMREAIEAGTYTQVERRHLLQAVNDVAAPPVISPGV